MSITEPLDDLGTCLVTGAAGFLGSHLVRRLLDEGYPVRAVIRNTPLDLEHPKLEIVQGEIEDAPRMLELCQGIDTVFHTAAHLALLGGSAASAAYRQTAYDANVGGVENLVAACYAQGVSRFVHTSSIDVCFNSEENLEMNGNTPYATNMSCLYTETKIEGEKVALAANGQRGLLTTSLRPDGIYGPGNNLMLDEMFEQVTKGAARRDDRVSGSAPRSHLRRQPRACRDPRCQALGPRKPGLRQGLLRHRQAPHALVRVHASFNRGPGLQRCRDSTSRTAR